MLTAVTGINWGDEGKGRVIDLLKPYPLSRTFLREREKQQFLPEPLLLSFY